MADKVDVGVSRHKFDDLLGAPGVRDEPTFNRATATYNCYVSNLHHRVTACCVMADYYI